MPSPPSRRPDSPPRPRPPRPRPPRPGSRALPAGVAAHHPATAQAALEILSDGGSAADATVAAVLASCVAETTMTGLGGGGHAIVWDAAAGRAHHLDFFVTVPGLAGDPVTAEEVVVPIAFATEVIPYAIGPRSAGVPGIAAGCGALVERYGTMSWARLAEPALRMAKTGTVVLATHATVLEMLAPVLTRNEGAGIYRPGGRLLRAGDVLRQPGLVRALELLVDEGPATFHTGTVAAAMAGLMAERGGPLRAADLKAYEAVWREPYEARHAGARLLGRRDLSGMLDVMGRLAPQAGRSPGERAVALARALGGRDADGHTTNTAVVDHAGNAVVATTSLGLGSADWVPGLDFQFNSMLGESDLAIGALVPGERMPSMTCPTVAVGPDGPLVVLGAAGGARIRSALVQVLSGVAGEGLDLGTAIERPRLHPVPPVVHVEPDFDEAAAAALAADGAEVRRWATRHHYFGGVSGVGRAGPAADSRRDGTCAVPGR